MGIGDEDILDKVGVAPWWTRCGEAKMVWACEEEMYRCPIRCERLDIVGRKGRVGQGSIGER